MAGPVRECIVRAFLPRICTDLTPCLLISGRTRPENKLCGLRFACVRIRGFLVVIRLVWVAVCPLSICLRVKVVGAYRFFYLYLHLDGAGFCATPFEATHGYVIGRSKV
jgi:hypothetical protein